MVTKYRGTVRQLSYALTISLAASWGAMSATPATPQTADDFSSEDNAATSVPSKDQPAATPEHNSAIDHKTATDNTPPTSTTTTTSTSTPRKDAKTDQVAINEQVVVDFNKGSAKLSKQNRDAISQTLASHLKGSEAKNKEVRVVVWADEAWPESSMGAPASKEAKKAHKADEHLASQRSEAIKAHLKKVAPSANVSVYKMVGDGKALAKDLHTDANELQSVFAKKGATADNTSGEVQMLSTQGGAGKAVIYLHNK